MDAEKFQSFKTNDFNKCMVAEKGQNLLNKTKDVDENNSKDENNGRVVALVLEIPPKCKTT